MGTEILGRRCGGTITGRAVALLSCAVLILGCAAGQAYRVVYSPGFSFARYNYLVVAKPGEKTSASLYGMDVEFANLMERYNWNVIGDKEYQGLTTDQQRQTLIARMAMISSSEEENLLTVSFDDAVTGKTVATVTTEAEGDMFDPGDRTQAFESLSKAIVQTLERDKGLKVTEAKAK